MIRRRARRDRQRGNSLLLAMIVMSALATLGSLTVVSVQGSLKASTNDRSQAIAMYAAESGAAVAMDFLRQNRVPPWAPYLVPTSDPAPASLSFASNRARPSTIALPTANVFSADQNAWYDVVLFNDRFEPPATDNDKRVVIQSTGHGPQGSLATIEVEVQLITPGAPPLGWQNGFTILHWRVVL